MGFVESAFFDLCSEEVSQKGCLDLFARGDSLRQPNEMEV